MANTCCRGGLISTATTAARRRQRQRSRCLMAKSRRRRRRCGITTHCEDDDDGHGCTAKTRTTRTAATAKVIYGDGDSWYGKVSICPHRPPFFQPLPQTFQSTRLSSQAVRVFSYVQPFRHLKTRITAQATTGLLTNALLEAKLP